MKIAILGGGLQGACLALALADRNIGVTIYDRNDRLMSRAAVANEGKIHLGYMYAADPSLRTAQAMLRGALSFAPFLSDHLGISLERFAVSRPAAYAVHRQSQKSAAEVASYLRAVHELVNGHPASNRDYFGRDLSAPIRQWESGELDSQLDTGHIVAAFDSPEVAIDPVALTEAIRARLSGTANVEMRLGHTVTDVKGDGPLTVVARVGEQISRERFDHVVNALWDGRIALDARRGQHPRRAWIHRLKYGVAMSGIPASPHIRSITIVSGPFGEVVNYDNGLIYLTWYPTCLTAKTCAQQPPIWPIKPQEPQRSQILYGTLSALTAIHPTLSSIDGQIVDRADVRGGPIVAWGNTDIDDPASELHRRYEIGVTSQGNYHSVDPGKLTSAPYFATQLAERIAGSLARGVRLAENLGG